MNIAIWEHPNFKRKVVNKGRICTLLVQNIFEAGASSKDISKMENYLAQTLTVTLHAQFTILQGA